MGCPKQMRLLLVHLVHWHLEQGLGNIPVQCDVLSDELKVTARTEARAILQNPALAHVFGDSLSEVTVSASVGDIRLHGAIDRLVVTPDVVTAIDFKTNRVIPERADECPSGILLQMWAYAAALTQIYPDRRIETAIIWTPYWRVHVTATRSCVSSGQICWIS